MPSVHGADPPCLLIRNSSSPRPLLSLLLHTRYVTRYTSPRLPKAAPAHTAVDTFEENYTPLSHCPALLRGCTVARSPTASMFTHSLLKEVPDPACSTHTRTCPGFGWRRVGRSMLGLVRLGQTAVLSQPCNIQLTRKSKRLMGRCVSRTLRSRLSSTGAVLSLSLIHI